MYSPGSEEQTRSAGYTEPQVNGAGIGGAVTVGAGEAVEVAITVGLGGPNGGEPNA